ncbi:MAG: hypothetical protein MIO93_09960 [ANME-2 cluster archaeon]|nr:hypothetical protein [ANME-2 cluster archaeon]
MLTTLFESIFQLDGNAFADSEKMVIELEMNSKKTELMRKLNKGLCALYMLNVHDMVGRAVGLRCEWVEW